MFMCALVNKIKFFFRNSQTYEIMRDERENFLAALISSMLEIALQAEAFLTFVLICSVGAAVAMYFTNQSRGVFKKVVH